MTKIEYSTPEQLEKSHAELLTALHKYRFWTLYHQKHFGNRAKRMVAYWGAKIDDLMNKYGLEMDTTRINNENE